ncbi:hypothetical protein [Aliikangiella coralliicola]|uniref:SPOR domain-containing protein n=1 Tax=Aliikangiella coralliicola TaxID=2592383 RepID=A0A545UCQ6_9GAMM|nr:hypothetical protein [Aliikangiella coralliicola]TQV87248.1 hypothetical protein FLL46_12400 [Aliikangiella coralliicola]
MKTTRILFLHGVLLLGLLIPMPAIQAAEISDKSSTNESSTKASSTKESSAEASNEKTDSEKTSTEKSDDEKSPKADDKKSKDDKKKKLPLLSTLWFDYSAGFPESALMFGVYYQEKAADQALNKVTAKQWKAEKIKMRNEQDETVFVLLTGKYKTRLAAEAAKVSLRTETGVRSKLVKSPESK